MLADKAFLEHVLDLERHLPRDGASERGVICAVICPRNADDALEEFLSGVRGESDVRIIDYRGDGYRKDTLLLFNFFRVYPKTNMLVLVYSSLQEFLQRCPVLYRVSYRFVLAGGGARFTAAV